MQVTDAANTVPELGQAVGASHQQSHVRSDVVKLVTERQHLGMMEVLLTKKRKVNAHFFINSRVVDVDG